MKIYIKTPEGNTLADEISKGSIIYSYNTENKEIELDRVVHFEEKDCIMVKITLSSGDSIRLPQFYYVYTTKGWVDMQHLEYDQLILKSSGGFYRLTNLERFKDKIYPIIVTEKNKNYFVDSILVKTKI